jgi:hypothetical protein
LFQTFRKAFLLEAVDGRAVDELFRIAARGVRIFSAEVFQNQPNAVENAAWISGIGDATKSNSVAAIPAYAY